MRRMLVTGGAGFIGAHLVRALVRRGDAVRIVDNFVTGTPENLSRALDIPLPVVHDTLTRARDYFVALTERCELQIGDIRDRALLASACDGIEIVFHHAALRSVPRSVADPLASHEANATGTLILLEAAHAAGVHRVINASSSSVYGDTPLPKHEDQVPQPRSPYAASKLAGEAYCQAYTRVFGLLTVSLRYFNVFGPWQDPRSEYAAVIPKFIRLALRGEPLPIDGDGQQSRDFTFVDNVVDANLRAAEAELHGPATLNVGAGERHSLLEFVERLQQILGRDLKVTHHPPRVGDVRHTEADISLAGSVLGYTPRIDFETGLRRTVRAIQEAGELAINA